MNYGKLYANAKRNSKQYWYRTLFNASIDHLYFNNFNPNTEFEKWATIEVTDFETVPDNMETFILTGGLYAVFLHKGSNTDNKTFQYIFKTWLPNSGYLLG